MIVEREFDSRAIEKEQISQEISSTRIELRKVETDLQNALRKLNDANNDVTAKQSRLERLERELEDQRRDCRSHDLDRERKASQISNLENKIGKLESEIKSLQDDLILSHRAYEQCKKQLEEAELSDRSGDQTETSTLLVDVTERPQQVTTLDIDVKPQVTTLDINVRPQKTFDYSFTPQTTSTVFDLTSQKQETTDYSFAQQTTLTEFDPRLRPRETSNYGYSTQTTTTEFEVTPQTTTLDIDVPDRHETTELEINIERDTQRPPVASWRTGNTSSFQVYRDRKYSPVQFALEEEEDGEYEIAQIESRRSSRTRWKY